MKCRNKIIFISLLMLILLSVTCVSAAQDIEDNSTLETSNLAMEEVSSSQDTESMEVQTSEVYNNSCELESDDGQVVGLQAESNDSCELESDDGQVVGLQAESNDSCELESDDGQVVGLQAVNNDDVENEVLAISNYDDVLSTIDGCSDGIEFRDNYVVVCGFPIEKKYKIRILRVQLNDYHPDSTGFRTFDAASSELEFFQFNRNRWYMFLMGDGYGQFNLVSHGKPIILQGGPKTTMQAIQHGSFFSGNPEAIYEVYFVGNFRGTEHGVFDARGLSSIAYINNTQSAVYFQKINMINAINGAVVIKDLNSFYLKDHPCKVVFEECNFKNITGGVVSCNYNSNIIFKNCRFENIEGGIVDSTKAVNITFENCYFDNITSSFGLVRTVDTDSNISFINCQFKNVKSRVGFEYVNSADGVLTVTLKPYTTHMGLVSSYGNVTFTNPEFWNGASFVKETRSNEFNIANRTIAMHLYTTRGNFFYREFKTDSNGQFKFNYKEDDDFYNISGGVTEFELFIQPDNNTLYSHDWGNFETQGDFTNLQNRIYKATKGSIIELYRDMTYSAVYDKHITKGIEINVSDITIDGNGYTIDAKRFSRIFYSNNDNSIHNVTIKNMVITNGECADGSGAIYFEDSYNIIIENVTFRGNKGDMGGAYYFNSDHGKLINCTFEANVAEKGGAIYLTNGQGDYKTIQGCTFENNAADLGGAIYDYNSHYNVNINDCIFIDNSANLGGAIYNEHGTKYTLTGNSFTSNKAKTGGAIYCKDASLKIMSSNFTSNVAETGGAIYINKNVDIADSYFKYNKANVTGVKVITDEDNQIVNVYAIGNDNYISAIHATDSGNVSFSNVSYWGDDAWVTTDAAVRSDKVPFALINFLALSTTKAVVLNDTTDVNGIFSFNYAGLPNGIYYVFAYYDDGDHTKDFITGKGIFMVREGMFRELQSLIDNTPEGGELVLLKDYAYKDSLDESITEGIVINKNITINGYGHKIDAKGKTRIFWVNATNVEIKNTIFNNASNVQGSVAYFNKEGAKIHDCIFVNNPGLVVSGKNADINDNWFGNGWNDYNVKSSLVGDFEVDRWYFLNSTITPFNVSVSLNNKYIKSNNSVIVDENSNLPIIDLEFNTTESIKIMFSERNVTSGNISVGPDNAMKYYAGEYGYYYDGPVGITFKYANKSFTRLESFAPSMSLEGLPSVFEYGNVSDCYLKVVGTFGESLSSYTSKFILLEFKNFITRIGPTEDGYSLAKLSQAKFEGPMVCNYNVTHTSLRPMNFSYPPLYGYFTIVPRTTSLNIVPVEEFYVGDAKNLTIILAHPSGNVPEGNLTVSINGNTTKIAVQGERVYNIDLTGYSFGEYNVTVDYHTNSSRYADNSDNITFEVSRYSTKIGLSIPESINYGENLNVTVNIVNETTATYRISDVNNVTVREGIISKKEFAIENLACGEYTLTVRNQGNSVFSESSASKNFTVNKVTPKFTIIYTIKGSTLNMTVSLDSNATGYISFNNKSVALVNGSTKYLEEFEPGYHVLTINYLTDNKNIFNQVNKSVSFYIINSTSELNNTFIDVVVEIAGNDVFLTAKVNESATGLIMFSLDGSSVFMPVINGQADYHTVLLEGDYVALIAYTGDSKFKENMTSRTISITEPVKEKTEIIPTVNINNNNVEISVDVNENATGYMAFTIDGYTYKVDVFDGNAVFNGYFNDGYHKVNVEYLGDDEFESNSTVVSFKVDGHVLKNTTVDLATKIDERNVELYINLDPETNGFALIDINGSQTYVKVDYGFAYYKTVLNPGDYSISVKYLGDENFNPAETNKNISIQQPASKDANLTLDISVGFMNYVLISIGIASDATGFIQLDINGSNTQYYLSGNNEFIYNYIQLSSGSYNISVGYSGDDYYNMSYVGKVITLTNIYNTTVDVDVVSNESDVSIFVKVNENATGLVEFNISGQSFYIAVEDGTAICDVVLDNGDYNLTVTYHGDELFNPNSTTATFKVEGHVKLNTTIDSDVVVDVNTVTVNVNVDEFASGFVEIVIAGKKYYAPVEDGKAVFVNDFVAGSYLANVTYLGDDNFNKNSTKVTFTVVNVTKLNTSIDFNVSVVENNVTIFAKVDENATGFVEFNVSGKSVYIAVEDGKAICEVVLDKGEYELTVIYHGDGLFNSNSTTTSFNVDGHIKLDTPISSDAVVDANTVTFTVNVDEFASGFVEITIAGKKYYVPVGDGKAVFVNDFAAGSYLADVTYLGDDNFNKNSTKVTFTVVNATKLNTDISLNIYVVENNVTVMANVDENATGLVEFNIDSKSVYIAVKDGKAVYNVVLDNGDYDVTVIYHGEGLFNSNSTTASFNVEGHVKLDTAIDSDVVVDANTVTVNVNVDEFATGFVEITIAGKKYYAPVEDGKAVFVNDFAAGSYLADVTYLGDDTFNKNSTKMAFTVVDVTKLNTDISIDVSVVENNVTISVNVDENATGLVEFNIEGKSFYIAVEDGNAVCDVVLDNGDYDVTVIYYGDGLFNSNSTAASFNVEGHVKSNTTISSGAVVDVNTVTVNVNVNKFASGFVEIVIAGKKYYAPVEDGKAVFVNDFAAGSYLADVTYLGDDNFNKNSTKVTFTVVNVTKLNTSIDFNVSVVENNVTIFAKVDENATGFVEFNVSGKSVYIAVEDGKAICEVVLDKGEYELTVIYHGDRLFNSNSTTTSFKVDGHIKLDTAIDSDVVVDANTVTVNVNVDEFASGFVEITIAGKKYYVPVGDGKAVFVNDFAAGSYLADVTYLGDDNFNKNSTKVTFTVVNDDKINTGISINVSVVENNVTISAKVNEFATGLVEFNIDSKSVYIASKDGKAVYNVVLDNGDYDVTVIYHGEGLFNSNSTATSFKVDGHVKLDTPISSDVVVDANTVAVNVNVDEFASGFVEITIAGKKYYAPVEDGKAVFVNDFAAGSYLADVTYLGDDNFNKNSTKVTFTVVNATKKNTDISIDVSVVENNVTISANVDEDATGLVEFNIDSKSVYIAVKDGKAVYNVVLDNGDYDVTVIYHGEGLFNSNSTATSFKVDGHVKLDTPIDSDAVVDANTVTVNVNVDEFATGFVEITIAGKKYYAPVEDGKAVFVNDFVAGSYLADVTYLGDDKFNKNSTEVTFTVVNVAKKNTDISLNVSVVGKTATFTVDVNETAAGLVKFVITGVDNFTAYTDVVNGQAVLKNILNEGNYTVVVTYMGDNKFNSNITSTEFNVKLPVVVKTKTVLSAAKVTATYKVAKKLVITLKDSAGKVLAGKKVTVKVGSISKTLTTNNKGQVSVNVANLVPKTYTATFKFAGDGSYVASSSTAKVVVKKAKAKITAKKKTFKAKKKTKKYTITLKANNKAIKKVKVTIKVGKKTYTAKTNSKGKATFKIKKLTKKGTYKATITYKGNKYYKKVTKKVKITIK